MELIETHRHTSIAKRESAWSAADIPTLAELLAPCRVTANRRRALCKAAPRLAARSTGSARAQPRRQTDRGGVQHAQERVHSTAIPDVRQQVRSWRPGPVIPNLGKRRRNHLRFEPAHRPRGPHQNRCRPSGSRANDMVDLAQPEQDWIKLPKVWESKPRALPRRTRSTTNSGRPCRKPGPRLI